MKGMLEMDEFKNIRSLHDHGASIRTIAHDLQMSRNTVRKYLVSDSPPKFHAPVHSNSALAPFEAEIGNGIKQGFNGSRILRGLRKLGYHGPQATFYRTLARLVRTTQAPVVIQRFETNPAHQAQYDWSEYVIPGACAPVKVYVSCLILGYSRYRHYHASLDITQASIFEAIEAGFTAFGGVPKEVLVDNPRALVTRVRPHLVWNGVLLALADHYSFLPRACWPCRAQTKGKVENPFGYLEAQFIIGLLWAGFPDFCLRLRAFEQEVNQRRHGTTGVPPIERMAEERPLLTPLPGNPFISPASEFRHVSMDCLIAFDRRRYSIPWQYAGKTVWIKIHAGAELEVYSQAGELLARHPLEHGSRRVIIKQEHYAGLHKDQQLQKTQLAEVFKTRFPDCGLFLEKLLAQYKFNATEQLRRILTLADSYGSESMKAAFERALTHNTFSVNFIRGSLEQLTETGPQLPSGPYSMTLPGLILPELNVKPDLNRYQRLIELKANQPDKKVSNE
jgi:transposase